MREIYIQNVIGGYKSLEGITYSEEDFTDWSDERLKNEAGWFDNLRKMGMK